MKGSTKRASITMVLLAGILLVGSPAVAAKGGPVTVYTSEGSCSEEWENFLSGGLRYGSSMSLGGGCGTNQTRIKFNGYYGPTWTSWSYGSGDSQGWLSLKSNSTATQTHHRFLEPGLSQRNFYLNV